MYRVERMPNGFYVVKCNRGALPKELQGQYTAVHFAMTDLKARVPLAQIEG